MNKKLKTVLIIVGAVIAAALLLHVTINYLIPFIAQMHGSAVY